MDAERPPNLEAPIPRAALPLPDVDVPVLVGAARRACLRLLPWAPEEHAGIVQEALTRTMAAIRGGSIRDDAGEMAGYVYGVARNCIQEVKRTFLRAELRGCCLPEDEAMLESLAVEGDISAGESLLPEELARRHVLAVLRFHLVHAFDTGTEKQRRRALRDTFIVMRHYLRGVPLEVIARQMGLTRRACQYAVDRTIQALARLLDPSTGEARSFVENSHAFADVTELSAFLNGLLSPKRAGEPV